MKRIYAVFNRNIIIGRKDDVYISDSPHQIEIHCPYFCEAASVSGNNLFINMTKMSALLNVTEFNVNTLSLANGVLHSSSTSRSFQRSDPNLIFIKC